MHSDQLEQMAHGAGFIAALDQSGGSSASTLAHYGIPSTAYSNDAEMFTLMHQMRTRIITNPAFTGDRIIATILFEDTIDRSIGGMDAAAYVWEKKHVVPFVKVDKGLAPEAHGVRLMNPMPGLDALLAKAIAKGVFGTKMRSFIHLADPTGIAAIVEQQFEIALRIRASGLMPILEPEVDIHSPDKGAAEAVLQRLLLEYVERLRPGEQVMLKLTLPEQDDLYAPLVGHPHVLRVAALSGGYTQQEATTRLARNHGVIGSFSRALLEGLRYTQSEPEFTSVLQRSVAQVYAASIT